MKKILIFLIIPMIFLSACGQNGDTAFYVDDTAVEKAELIFYMERLLDTAVSEIEDEYGLIYEGQEGYWETSIGSITPMEYLKKSAVDEIARIKVIQLEAKKFGIKTETQYSVQIENWKEDNAKRLKDEQAGEIVYGVVERDFYTYANICFLEAQRDLQKKLEEKEIIITEAEMKEYYNKHPDYFKGKKYEDVVNAIRGWIFDERYEKYVEKLISKAKISYENMEVEPQQFE